MIADGEWHGHRDAAPIARVGRILDDLLSGDEISIAGVLRCLGATLVNPRTLLRAARNDGCLHWRAFALRIPGAVEVANTWDGGGLGMSGSSSFVFLPMRGRAALMKRFAQAEQGLQALQPVGGASGQ